MKNLIDKIKGKKALLFFIPVIIGFLIFFIAGKRDQSLSKKGVQERASLVAYIPVQEVSIIPKVTGFGSVQPTDTWDAVAEVSGKVIRVNPQLRKGAHFPRGTALLEIDPTDYQLAVRQAEANLQSAKAKLVQLKSTEKNTHSSYKLEKKSLAFAEKELKRLTTLAKQGAGSTKAVDQQERTVLSARQSLQSKESSIEQLPSERKVLEAQIAVNQASLESAKRNLERTRFILPFDARISQVNVQESQYAKAGSVLIVADGIHQVDVTAQIMTGKMKNLISHVPSLPKMTPVFFSNNSLSDTSIWKNRFGLSARVLLKAGEKVIEWDAEVQGTEEGLDPKSRTMGIIVSVKDSYKQAIPGIKPLLAKNMYVEVELSGKPKQNVIVIPQTGLHNNEVYLVNEENRLEIRTVQVQFTQEKMVIIKSGLAKGEKLILTDISPAISGMLLKAELDATSLGAFKKAAKGEK